MDGSSKNVRELNILGYLMKVNMKAPLKLNVKAYQGEHFPTN